jgi:hypothetical protein
MKISVPIRQVMSISVAEGDWKAEVLDIFFVIKEKKNALLLED